MNIKKIYIGIGFTAALSVFSSCSDIINVEPEFVKDGSQIFSTITDYQYALTGAYSRFREVGYFGSGGQTTSSWGVLPDMMSDILSQTGDDLANWQNQSNWEYETNENDLEVAWIAAYNIIAQANLVVRNIEQFESSAPKHVNRLKGQALAIRGYVHFDLLRFWGESYGLTDTGKGIPYVETVDLESMPSRLTVAQSWTKILADLTQAEALLADVDTPVNMGTTKNFLDLAAVRAILARAYLYAGNYTEAEKYATYAIASVPLASATAFGNIWTDATNAEVLWKVAFSAGEGSPSSGLHNGPSNRNRFRPTTNLLALYDQTNDIRYDTYFGSRNAANGQPRLIVKKFMGRGANIIDNLVDWKAFRVSEQYLIRAESRARLGKTELANEDLNALRTARISGFVALTYSGDTLLEQIATERMKELVAEGHRFFDLKRTFKVVNRADVTLVSTARTLPSTHRAWTWPIPQVEMDANSNMAGQQTSGY